MLTRLVLQFVGSAAIGCSLNPVKNFKPFDSASDVDVAVISNYHFTVAWRYLRTNGTRRLEVDTRTQRYLNTTHRSAVWFKKTFDAGDLVIKPPFQRNPVWSIRQKSSLIDTILLEYPIPELYMQEVTTEG